MCLDVRVVFFLKEIYSRTVTKTTLMFSSDALEIRPAAKERFFVNTSPHVRSD